MSEHKTDNELIAEFMNDQKWFFNDAKRIAGDELVYLKYHKSWDWLMPVVEKIAKLNYGVSITTWPKEWDAPIVGVQVMIHDNGDDGPVIERHSEPEQMITSIYKVVVEFIKWYNENGK